MNSKGWLYSLPAAAAFAVALGGGGCSSGSVSGGTCAIDPQVVCGANSLGYSCTGTDRPDQIADTTKAVSEHLCSVVDPVNGKAAFCCTDMLTTCGYDPRVQCMDSTTGFSCLGTNRPDSYDSDLMCEQGIHAYGLISYCCGQTITTTSCMRNTSVNCPSNAVLGFSCTNNKRLPTETDLGMNQSRSEVPLICNLGIADVVDPTQTDYCCYTPSAAPPGYTCLQNQLVGLVSDLSTVPGCKAGTSFGFACLGTQDTPELDYPRMACPNGPTQVTVGQQPLQLYCCNYSLSP